MKWKLINLLVIAIIATCLGGLAIWLLGSDTRLSKSTHVLYFDINRVKLLGIQTYGFNGDSGFGIRIERSILENNQKTDCRIRSWIRSFCRCFGRIRC